DVDVEREQIANRVGVLGAIEPVQRRRVETRAGRRRAIQPRLELRGKSVEYAPFRPSRAAWRHHAGPDLPDDLLPRRRIARDVFEVFRVEREPRDLRAIVVTGDAVLA